MTARMTNSHWQESTLLKKADRTTKQGKPCSHLVRKGEAGLFRKKLSKGKKE